VQEADWLVVRRVLKKNWQGLADELGISIRNLRRYRIGELQTPRVLQLALEGLMCREFHGTKPVQLERPMEMLTAGLLRKMR
jgi:hypothetical protein